MEPALASVALNALLLHCTVLGAGMWHFSDILQSNAIRNYRSRPSTKKLQINYTIRYKLCLYVVLNNYKLQSWRTTANYIERLARSVPSPRPRPRRLIIYLPVPSSAVTLSRRPVVDMIWPPAAGGMQMLRPVPSSRLFLDYTLPSVHIRSVGCSLRYYNKAKFATSSYICVRKFGQTRKLPLLHEKWIVRM